MTLSQRRRLTIGLLVGAATGIAVGFVAPWQMAVLSGWDVAALLFVMSIWMFIPALDGEMTSLTARREDLSTINDDLVVLVASVISLVGVVLTLVAAKDASTALKAWMTTIAFVTVAVSWVTVHTVFTLRYARLYYDPPEGGIDFNSDSRPDYLDFAYLAFTVGMTYQVSDTSVSDRSIRRAITRHALLGFVFGVVIIGVTINIVGGLIQK
jgi:uncharacterized membrane protein